MKNTNKTLFFYQADNDNDRGTLGTRWRRWSGTRRWCSAGRGNRWRWRGNMHKGMWENMVVGRSCGGLRQLYSAPVVAAVVEVVSLPEVEWIVVSSYPAWWR